MKSATYAAASRRERCETRRIVLYTKNAVPAIATEAISMGRLKDAPATEMLVQSAQIDAASVPIAEDDEQFGQQVCIWSSLLA